MKNTASQYAKALIALTEGKNEKEISVIMKNFCQILRKRGQWKIRQVVFNHFVDLWKKTHKIIEAEVETQYSIGDAEREEIKHFVSTKYPDKEIMIKEKVNEKTKGGIVIRVGDQVFDMSLKTQIRKLQNLLATK